MKNSPLSICGVNIQPGERVTLALPTPEIYTCVSSHIPMHILHGKKEGPRLLICGTFHGDEMNGIAIVQRLLHLKILKNLVGTLIAIPVMNIYGLINRSRFLPDGHDLESSFPGSETGSFSSRFASAFTSKVLNHCTHYLNIETGGPNCYEIPHIVYQKEDEMAYRLAKRFGSSLIKSKTEQLGIFHRDGNQLKRPVLIYKGGEANRIDEWPIRVGVKGICRLMRELGMVRLKTLARLEEPYEVSEMTWMHAPGSGLFSFKKRIGVHVEKGESLGMISDPFGTGKEYAVIAQETGTITAITTQPLVYEGQAVVQIGSHEKALPPPLPIDIPAVRPDIVNN